MRVTEEPITAYAFCSSALCTGDSEGRGGYRQEQVAAIRQTVVRVFGDQSSSSSDPIDIAFSGLESTSHVYLQFANPADIECQGCLLPRLLAEQIRPVYESLSQSLLTRQAAAKKTEERTEIVEEIAERLEKAEAANRKAAAAGPKP